MLILGLAVISLVATLFLVGLHDQARVRARWDFTLTMAGSRAHADFASKIETGAEVRAFAAQRAELAVPERRRAMMDVGLRLIERDSHDMATTLRGIGVLSRMAAAVVPVRQLRPGAFRLGQLRGLAAIGALAHHLAVTTAERLRLRAYVLRGGCGIVARAARRAVRRQRLDRLGVAGADLTAIGREALETFHALLLSMDAAPREHGPLFVIDDWP